MKNHIPIERLGSELHYKRKEDNLSFLEPSRKIGISASYLSEIEKGWKMPMRSETLKRLFKYLGYLYRGIDYVVEKRKLKGEIT